MIDGMRHATEEKCHTRLESESGLFSQHPMGGNRIRRHMFNEPTARPAAFVNLINFLNNPFEQLSPSRLALARELTYVCV